MLGEYLVWNTLVCQREHYSFCLLSPSKIPLGLAKPVVPRAVAVISQHLLECLVCRCFGQQLFYLLDGTFGVSIRFVVVCGGQLVADVISCAPFVEWSTKLWSSICSDANRYAVVYKSFVKDGRNRWDWCRHWPPGVSVHAD